MNNLTQNHHLNSPKTNIFWLGSIPYSWALELQENLVEKVRAGNRAFFLLGLEHPRVITFGKRSHMSSDLKIPLENLDSLGFQYYAIDRGGHATLHNPGQLVIYPIVNLKKNNIPVREFVELLTRITKETFNELGIKTEQCPNQPGLYTESGKIAFLGLRIKEGVSYHGLSINISNNLEDFSFINSCGVSCEKFDKVSNYKDIKAPEFFKIWSLKFTTIFGVRIF